MRNISLEELAKLFNEGFPYDPKRHFHEQSKVEIFNGLLVLSFLEGDYKSSGGTIFAYKGNLILTPDTPQNHGSQNFAVNTNPGNFEFYFQKSEKDCFFEESLYSPLIIPTPDETKKLWFYLKLDGKILY